MATQFRLIEVPTPTDGETTFLHSALEALSGEESMRLGGNLDQMITATEFVAGSLDSDTRRTHILIATSPEGVAGEDLTLAHLESAGALHRALSLSQREFGAEERGVGEVAESDAGKDADQPSRLAIAGALSISYPLRDNLETADLEVMLADDFVGSGVEAILLRIAEDVVRAQGRTRLEVWTEHSAWEEASEADTRLVHAVVTALPTDGTMVSPVQTSLSVELQEAGYRAEFSEWINVLNVDQHESMAIPVEGYEALTWHSPQSPLELLDELAPLYALASTDMPSGSLTRSDEVWDVGRVVRKEQLATRSNTEWLVAAVRPVGGELVGWSKINVTGGDAPVAAFQEGTLTREEHRGRGLATWMKRANVAQLRDLYPSVRRVWTWNSGGNTPVIALNIRFGFTPARLAVAWEKKL
ncbi:GNAT family N-acetyltransferase [Changpingibacter yushuensis]|uniref:GNAT family N-acetyltransferase n=1 Tax=Changpingibacter yushuensis TaxID=2758440 RepID=UPI0015F54A60|nr:GNAT family N-acetyltransferase [Changpingibacter yushuensis]